MSNYLTSATLTIWTLIAASSMAFGGTRDPAHEAKILGFKVKDLGVHVRTHAQLPGGEQAVCQLSAAVLELQQVLQCPHDAEAIRCSMDEVQRLADLVVAYYQRDCGLRESYLIRDLVERVLNHVTRTRLAVESLLIERSDMHALSYGLSQSGTQPLHELRGRTEPGIKHIQVHIDQGHHHSSKLAVTPDFFRQIALQKMASAQRGHAHRYARSSASGREWGDRYGTHATYPAPHQPNPRAGYASHLKPLSAAIPPLGGLPPAPAPADELRQLNRPSRGPMETLPDSRGSLGRAILATLLSELAR